MKFSTTLNLIQFEHKIKIFRIALCNKRNNKTQEKYTVSHSLAVKIDGFESISQAIYERGKDPSQF